MSTAIVLMTHRFDPSILEEFQRLRESLGPSEQAFLLSDGSAPAPPSLLPLTHAFDCATVLRRAARVIEEGILRNIHLAWIDFFEAHPDFDAYWFIEYDVFYAGAWGEFFEAFRKTPYDLLCCHLRPRAHEPGWCWWPALHSPSGALTPDQMLRGLLTITRLSRQGFARLTEAVDEGWWGFMEGLIPTLFQASGLRIGDIGGDGPFVPEGFRNRFYTSASDPVGSLVDLGTMRCAPPIRFPRILPGRLYHPVKPDPDSFDAGVGRPEAAWAALDRAVDTIRGLRPPPQLPPFLACAYVDHLLQVLTGLRTSELLEALDRMAVAGVEPGRAATLRRDLLALPAFPASPSRITRIPAGGYNSD